MIKSLFLRPTSFDDRMGCFGQFSMQDAVCKNYCALRIRCAVEKEQNAKLELIEDLVSTDNVPVTVQ